MRTFASIAGAEVEDTGPDRRAFMSEPEFDRAVRAQARNYSVGEIDVTIDAVQLQFGLGKIESIDRAEVIWPDGEMESFPIGKTDRQVVLKKGSGGMSKP